MNSQTNINTEHGDRLNELEKIVTDLQLNA